MKTTKKIQRYNLYVEQENENYYQFIRQVDGREEAQNIRNFDWVFSAEHMVASGAQLVAYCPRERIVVAG